MPSDIEQIIEKLIVFRDERNWKQFHSSKDLALALSIEVAEVNELFLWKTANPDTAKLAGELADVFAFAFLLAHENGLDVKQIVSDKIELNRMRYPVNKSRNSSKKYTDL